MKRPFILLPCLAALAYSVARAADADDKFLGQKFMARASAVYRAEPSDEAAQVNSARVPAVFYVAEVRGDWLLVGKAWLKKSEVVPFADALEYFLGYLKAHPEAALAHHGAGMAYLEMDEMDSAIEQLTQAVRLDPRNAGYFTNRGAAWAREREWDKAIADFTTAVTLDPNFDVAYAARGRVWRDMGEFDKAFADFDESIRLYPHEPKVFADRGGVWQSKKDLDKALADYTSAIRLDPRSPRYYRSRFLVWIAKGDMDHALADVDAAIQLDPRDAFAYVARGELWGRKGEIDKAIADFTAAIDIQPRAASAYAQRARALNEKEGNSDKAFSDLDIALEIEPQNSLVHYCLGVVWQKNGDPERALAEYGDALKRTPQHFRSLINSAWICATSPIARLRNGKKAVDYAQSAYDVTLDKTPGDSAARRDCMIALAAAYAEAGEFDNAVQWQQKALELAAEKDKPAMTARLELFRAGQPYRDEAKKL